jgi:hypothetical protein
VALVYGANASGKTNLTEAIDFLRTLVLEGVQAGAAIHRQAFKLDPVFAGRPTVFEMDFVALNETPYRYRIAVDDSVVVEEMLVEIRRSSEARLFHRKGSEFDLGGLLKTAEGRERKGFLRFTAEGTRPNQPFLAEARQRAVTKAARCRTAFRWARWARGSRCRGSRTTRGSGMARSRRCASGVNRRHGPRCCATRC